MTTPQGADGDRLDRIERIVEGIAADVSEIKGEITSMGSRMVSMEDRMAVFENDMAVVKNDVAVMGDRMTVMEGRMAVFGNDMAVMKNDMAVTKGWQTELAVERRAGRVFARLCGGELLRIYPDSELRHYTSHGRRTGAMSREDVNRAESVDFLLEGTDANGEPVMYAVEVSYTGGPDDSDRAIEKASLLTRLLGRDVKPAVVGESFTAQFEADASRRNVAYANIRDGGSVIR